MFFERQVMLAYIFLFSVDSMTISYGYVFSSEEKWNSVYDIAKAADKRMYESKANFYRQKRKGDKL